METKQSGQETVSADEPLIAYKGFDKNLQCRGYQFEVGKTFTHTGKVQACSGGFHSCENPLDVLDYYPLDSRFAVVKASGRIDREGNKLASASIEIQAELKLPEFIGAAVNYIKAACNFESKPVDCASGDSSQLAASGDYSKLAASGYSSKLAASGYSSQLAASGDYSKLAASGDYSQLAASGKSSIAMAASHSCRAKAGELGCIVLSRWVESEKRYRVSVGYVGENIKADTWYEVNATGEFVEVAA
jgi:hypothetical protein